MFKSDHPDRPNSLGERIERIKYVRQMRADARKLQVQELKQKMMDAAQSLPSIPLGLLDRLWGIFLQIFKFVTCGIWFWFGHQIRRLAQFTRDVKNAVSEIPGWTERVIARREMAMEARAVREASRRIGADNRVATLELEEEIGEAQDGSMALRSRHFLKVAAAFVFVSGLSLYVGSVVRNSDAFANSHKHYAPRIEKSENALSDSATIDRQLAKLADKSLMFGTGAKVPINELNQVRDDAKRLSSKDDLTTSQLSKLDLVRAHVTGMSFQSMTESDTQCGDEIRELTKFCDQYEESDDLELQMAAKFWRMSIVLVEFASNPDSADFESYKRAIAKYGNVCASHSVYAKKAAVVLQHMGTAHRNKEVTPRALRVFHDQIKSSDNQDILSTAGEIYDLAAFGRYDLPSLRRRVLWGDATAKEDLLSAIKILEEHSDCGFETWSELILACECLIGTDNSLRETEQAIDFIASLVQRLPDSSKKEALKRKLDRQAIRMAVARSKFDPLIELYPHGGDFESSNHEFSLVLFADSSKDSSHTLKQLKLVAEAIAKNSQSSFHALVVLKDGQGISDFHAANDTSNTSVATAESSLRLCTEFPVDVFPYALLLDRNKKVIASNVNVNAVETKMRRYNASKNSPDGGNLVLQ